MEPSLHLLLLQKLSQYVTQLLDKRMWWLAAALSALHPLLPDVLRVFIRKTRCDATRWVLVCVVLSVFVPIACVRAALLDVVMQGTCLTLASRVTILPECMCGLSLPSLLNG